MVLQREYRRFLRFIRANGFSITDWDEQTAPYILALLDEYYCGQFEDCTGMCLFCRGPFFVKNGFGDDRMHDCDNPPSLYAKQLMGQAEEPSTITQPRKHILKTLRRLMIEIARA